MLFNLKFFCFVEKLFQSPDDKYNFADESFDRFVWAGKKSNVKKSKNFGNFQQKICFLRFHGFNFAPQNTMSEEIKILGRCEKLFLRYGIKSVTMDDVSRELGISKKTLYQFVENKEELVKKVTTNHFACEHLIITQIIKDSKTAVDEMVGIAKWMNNFSKNIHPGLLFDLKKYHPESWQVYLDYRNQEIFRCIFENIERGKREGFYREELDANVLARIYIARVEMFIDAEIFPPQQFPAEKTFTEFMNYHIHGLATQKGIKYWDKIKTSLYEKQN